MVVGFKKGDGSDKEGVGSPDHGKIRDFSCSNIVIVVLKSGGTTGTSVETGNETRTGGLY